MLKSTISTQITGLSSELRFELQNSGSSTVHILYWHTAFDSVCPARISVETTENESIPYRGPRAKYHFNPTLSLISIAPGSSIETRVKIAENYDLPEKNNYQIFLGGPLLGYTGNWNDDITLDNLSEILVEAIPTTVNLSPADTSHLFPKAFQSEELPSSAKSGEQCFPPLCQNSYKQPPYHCVMGIVKYGQAKIEAGTEDQRSIVFEAVDRLFRRLTIGRGAMSDVGDNGVYRRWFGPFTANRAIAVRDAINGMYGQAICKTFVIYVRPTNGGDRVASFQFSPSTDQYNMLSVYPPFFAQREEGLDTFAGTIAHELSHGYAGTSDFEYGVNNCLTLAINNPENAVRNADSIEYFLEETALASGGYPLE